MGPATNSQIAPSRTWESLWLLPLPHPSDLWPQRLIGSLYHHSLPHLQRIRPPAGLRLHLLWSPVSVLPLPISSHHWESEGKIWPLILLLSLVHHFPHGITLHWIMARIKWHKVNKTSCLSEKKHPNARSRYVNGNAFIRQVRNELLWLNMISFICFMVSEVCGFLQAVMIKLWYWFSCTLYIRCHTKSVLR